MVQVFQSTDFSEFRFFRVHVFWIQAFLGSGFSGFRPRVWIEVLEEAKNGSSKFYKIPRKTPLFETFLKRVTVLNPVTQSIETISSHVNG